MTGQTQNVIVVKNLNKVFNLPHERTNSVKGLLINLFRKPTYEKQQALKDINFTVKEGEFFGIIGRNGSGKSTLLKILAEIYTPTNGEVHVKGKLVPFIELGVGFNPDLTGRENVFLNGALLGFSRAEMTEMYEDIVKFAELERFMDQKLKNYSSGMQVRLAFSIAIRAKGDILLLDEILAVGDQAFQFKCLDYFVELKKNGKTVVLVTHDMNNVTSFCDRVLVIDKSKQIEITTPSKAAEIYKKINS
jgi:ABC-2 type transport system ATP-binding protein